MIVKRESLKFAARRLAELSEEETGNQLVLYVIQHIYGSGEKRYHPVVKVAINGNKRKAKARFRRECDEAISYIMGCKLEGRPKSPATVPEWESPSDRGLVEDFAREYIPSATGAQATVIRQMWIKADVAGMMFIGPMCEKNGVEYEQFSNHLIVLQGDKVQMGVLSQHFRALTDKTQGISILKEVEIPHCMNANDLEMALDYLGGKEEYKVTMVGKWAMIQNRKTRRVTPIFNGDHFGSLEWMDDMTTPAKARKAMEVTAAHAVDHLELEMSWIYAMYYLTLIPRNGGK
jgi:hypothetical protein